MTLASMLMKIKTAENGAKDQLSKAFSDYITGHPEEKILRDCLVQAQLGRGYLDFGRGMFMPETLQDEGFHLEMAGPGFHLHFDWEAHRDAKEYIARSKRAHPYERVGSLYVKNKNQEANILKKVVWKCWRYGRSIQ